jgi:hypothetical protein
MDSDSDIVFLYEVPALVPAPYPDVILRFLESESEPEAFVAPDPAPQMLWDSMPGAGEGMLRYFPVIVDDEFYVELDYFNGGHPLYMNLHRCEYQHSVPRVSIPKLKFK